MRAFARRLAVTALCVAGCSSDSPDRDFGDTMDPGTAADAGSDLDGSDADGEPGEMDGEDDEDGAADGMDLPSDDPADVCGDGTEALARDISIRDVALYQTVKIDLVENGVWSTSRPAPVVQGKKALVRVFLDTGPDFQIHGLTGVLTIENGGVKKYLTDSISPTGPSTDEAPNSTLNFDVDASDIGASTTFSVAVVETTCPSQPGESTARFPSEGGTRALETTKIGKLRVVIVPFTVNGLTPDTSAEQLEGMRQAMLAFYPVPEVEISARPAIDWSRTNVRADGTGWSDTLNEVANLRYEDGVDDDVYYYGVMTPESSFNGFCRQGCVLGLAPQTTWISPDQQVGLGVGFVNEETFTTMVHELGHAHGRGHAPCGGPAGVDRNFPNTNANIDTWGWDSRTGTLQRPTYKDVMAYCAPAWISPYTYAALAERCSEVNVAFRVAPSSARWNSMVLYADGTARWGRTRTTRLPGGDDETALVKDARGQSLGEVRVVRVRLSHAEDSFLYVPDPKPEWATLVLGDRELSLSSVKPAL